MCIHLCALEIRTSAFGPVSLIVEVTLERRGELEERRGELERAVLTYEAALAVGEGQVDDRHLEMQRLFRSMLRLYQRTGRSVEAARIGTRIHPTSRGAGPPTPETRS